MRDPFCFEGGEAERLVSVENYLRTVGGVHGWGLLGDFRSEDGARMGCCRMIGLTLAGYYCSLAVGNVPWGRNPEMRIEEEPRVDLRLLLRWKIQKTFKVWCYRDVLVLRLKYEIMPEYYSIVAC